MTTEDNGARVSSDESSERRQRRKRKWDQPAEFLVSAGAAVPGLFPVANMGSVIGVMAGIATIPQVFQASPVQHSGSQPKIQDELIAREIVINDAESSVRYKLTKRQMQEEIQKCTGAVVITRGKYRPPNAPPDGEKPLYLHISAGAHLKEMSERIIAVDRAAAMVEEMLKQGLNMQPPSSFFHAAGNVVKLTQVSQALSTCVYLGFETDASMNVAARIRGPNDQYINHIMNETGANVLLRGCGSGNLDDPQSEVRQPLHLFLSSNNPKSLEDARSLAENLLDTISIEFGATRASSVKVYGAVPPPQQLASIAVPPSDASISISNTGALPTSPMPAATGPGVANFSSHGTTIQPNLVPNPLHSLSGGTSYNGYGGIYPQATPLQQVALALRQPPSPVVSVVAPATSQATMGSKSSTNTGSEKDKKPPHRRKFQELPVASKGSAQEYQGSSILKTGESIVDLGVKHISTMPAPMKLLQQSSNGMPPPPPRSMPPLPAPSAKTMPPPPPPTKFTSSVSNAKVPDKTNLISLKTDSVPDTLIKLMEYGDGEDDDDLEETNEESSMSNINTVATRKPFWAL